MNTLLQDLRYGARMLIKKPGFTLIAVFTLALGIGANTAIFSVVNAVLLRPLPYEEPSRLVWVWGRFSQGNQASVSPPDFLDYRAQNRAFEEFAAMRFYSFNLTGTAEPERVGGAQITTNFFKALGVKPTQGRDFSPEEEQAGRGQVAIISHGLWQRRFGADAAIVGKTLLLDGQSYEVIGVVPDDTLLPQAAEVWTPLNFDLPEMKVRRFHFLRPIARLRSGVSVQQAQADVDTVAAGLEQIYPNSNTTWGLRLVGLREFLVGDARPALYVLLGAVALVLLIGCVNIANLLLARAAARQKEISLRLAVGATRLRLIRQLLTESLLLSAAGGIIGLFFALWGTDLLVAMTPGSLPRAAEIGIDSRVLVFTFALSLLTGIVFGLVPALQASKVDLHESLKGAGKGSASGARHNRTRSLLVVSEFALALLLLIGAGLLVKSFRQLQAVDVGFDPWHVLTMRIVLPDSKYAEPEQIRSFFDEVLQRTASLPGVESVGTTTQLPLQGGGDTYFTIDGHPPDDPNQKPLAFNPQVSHDYLKTMGIPLIKGRHFTQQEAEADATTVIINETFAQTYFADEEPIGKRLTIDMGKPLHCEIIGVARDIKLFSLASQNFSAMYLPSIRTGFSNLVVRTAGEPLAMTAAIRNVVQSVDKNQPVANIRSMEQILASSAEQSRFRAVLIGIFAVVALILAGVGIYGVMAYLVTQQTHEIGIRMALGAQRKDVLKLILRQGIRLTVVGVIIGLASAFALTRFLSDLLFKVSATDPATFTAVALLLTLVALLACWIPARRATRVDPMVALRYE
ncbi:MAG: putative transport system permease protein [Blastocatellia bacterium]